MKKKSGIYLDILSHVLLIGATIVAISHWYGLSYLLLGERGINSVSNTILA